MRIFETVDHSAIADGIAFHDSLNDKLWQGESLKPEVRLHMLKIARDFYQFIGIEGLQIIDITFTGSNASYNYTKYSDCDIHIIVDYTVVATSDFAENFFNAKKNLWNRMHNVSIKGYPVEVYVESVHRPVNAAGVYSLLKNDWVIKPEHKVPEWDDSAVFAKVDYLAAEIDTLVQGKPKRHETEAMLERLYKMRRAALEEGGEFSVENLAFKALRNAGLIDTLRMTMVAAEDEELTLEALDESILNEGEIPPSGYGYWITPEGEFLVVGFEDHAQVAHENGYEGYVAAFEEGCIRICTFGGYLTAEFEIGKPTIRAVSALGRLVRKEAFPHYYLTVRADCEPLPCEEEQSFTKPSDFMLAARQAAANKFD